MSQPSAPTSKRVLALVDGFNLYHSIDDCCKKPDPVFGSPQTVMSCKWQNVASLASAFAGKGNTVGKTVFFTAKVDWSRDKRKRQEALWDAYRALDIEVVEGRFGFGQQVCRGSCGETFPVRNEKETDVNIAVRLMQAAHSRAWDVVLLITGDSDQVPAVKLARSIDPNLTVKIVVPFGRKCEELIKAAHQVAYISFPHLLRNRLDAVVHRSDGAPISCPKEWARPA